MKKSVSIIIVMIGCAGPVHSQTSTTSPYSVYGIGVLNNKSSALNRAMGQVGIGIRDPNNLNNLNPAAYTSVQGPTHIFELGLYTEYSHYQTRKNSDDISSGNLSGINAWFRFSKKWAGVLGLSPFSNVNYSIASSRNIGVDNGSAVTYSGSGGITQFYFGNAFQIFRNLSIGVDGSFLFGTFEKNETITSGPGVGTVLKNKVAVNRLKADFGAQYSIPMGKSRSFSFGVTYSPSLRLNTSSDRMLISTVDADTTFSEDLNIADYVLPYSVGTGVSFQTMRSTFAFDYTYKAWSEAVLEDNVKLRNTSRLAIGYTYEGNPNGESYWDFIRFKAGAHAQNGYLVLNNTLSDEWGVSAGLGFPLSGNKGTINLSYHYTQLGTLQNDLIKQRSNVIMLDITFRDLWGIRRKFD